MELIQNLTFLRLLIISNFISVLLLLTAWKFPKISRLIFSLMFLSASAINWHMAINRPQEYFSFADYSFFSIYSNFIKGWWFHSHVTALVGLIATCQLLIAVGMVWKGIYFKIAATCAIIFLLSIAPLGPGAGFPSTIIMSIAMYLLLLKGSENFIWTKDRESLIANKISISH